MNTALHSNGERTAADLNRPGNGAAPAFMFGWEGQNGRTQDLAVTGGDGVPKWNTTASEAGAPPDS